MTAEEYVALQVGRTEDTNAWCDWLAEHRIDAIVEPTIPIVAPLRGSGYDEVFGDVEDLSLTHYWDWTGLPGRRASVRRRESQRAPGERLPHRRARAPTGTCSRGARRSRTAGYGVAVIDLAAVSAIDVHVHTELARDGHDPMPAELREAAGRYFGSDEPLPTVDDVAAYYRERGIAAVVFTVDWESRSGIPPIPNEEIAEAAAANADVLIPFASVDPARPDAVDARDS